MTHIFFRKARNCLTRSTAAGLLLAGAVTMSNTVQANTDLTPASGQYAGSYVCQDGEHGVMLDMAFSKRNAGAGYAIKGSLTFFPVLAGGNGEFASVLGKFTIEGVLRDDGDIRFRHQKWIEQPDGYGAANFRGRLTKRTDDVWQIDGVPLAGPNSDFCSAMLVTRLPGS